MKWFFSCFLLFCSVLVCPVQAGPVEIVFWHSLVGNAGDELTKLTTLFNKNHPDFLIKPVYKGEYTDLLTSFAAAFRAGKPPAMVQVFEVGTASMLSPAGIIKPVYELMREQGIKLPLDSFLPSVRAFYSKAGQLQAMPFNISVPLVYYNKDVLDRLGFSGDHFPRTWDAMEVLFSRLKATGYTCGYTTAYPAWIHIESFSALHGLSLIKDGKASYNRKAIVNHLDRLKRWQNLHYFQYGGRRSEATALFTSGQCVLFTQSSGAYNSLSTLVKFKLGVAALPLDTSVSTLRHNNIAGGAALWAVTGQSAEVYKGIALFFDFIAQAQIQQRWYENTGYLPIGLQGIYEGLVSKADSPVLRVAREELNKPQDNYPGYYQGPQNQIRTINDEALEMIFAGISTPKQAMDAAVARADYLLLRFIANTR